MNEELTMKEEETNSTKEIINPKEIKVNKQIPRMIIKGIPMGTATHRPHSLEEENRRFLMDVFQKKRIQYVNRRHLLWLGRCGMN